MSAAHHVYTFAQLEHLWTAAGGSHALAPVMAAIAEAESAAGGRPYGDVYASQGPTSWGLWQIHTRNASACLVNTDTGGRPYYEHALVMDPAYNARAAVRIEHSQGLNAWSTYQTGAYLAYMPRHAARVSYQPAHHLHASTAHVPPRPHHIAHPPHAQGPSLAVAFGMIWMSAIATLVMRREVRAQRAPARRGVASRIVARATKRVLA